MRVRALQLGWYGKQRRRPGEEFDIAGVHELGKWMERVNKPGRKAKEEGEKSPESEQADE